MIAILGMGELSDEERQIAQRARRLQRFLTQPLVYDEQFSTIPGRVVSLEETIDGFEQILGGASTTSRAGLLHGRHDRRCAAQSEREYGSRS